MCFFGGLITLSVFLHQMNYDLKEEKEETVISLVSVHKYPMRKIFQKIDLCVTLIKMKEFTIS